MVKEQTGFVGVFVMIDNDNSVLGFCGGGYNHPVIIGSVNYNGIDTCLYLL